MIHWRDGIEILFFSSLFYYLALWLRKDKHNNLLPYFYGLCLFAFCAHFLQLNTITSFLFLFAPVAIMIFILMHQDILQRNIIAYKQISTQSTITHNWLETLLRSFLISLNNNKEILCIIEHTDNLQPFIKTPFKINAELSQGLLELLLESKQYDQDKMLWINSNGQLIAINATWQTTEKFSTPIFWRDEAIAYTEKTDATIVHLDATSRTFSLIANGTIKENLAAHQIFGLIKKQIQYPFEQKEKGKIYDTAYKNNSTQQRSP